MTSATSRTEEERAEARRIYYRAYYQKNKKKVQNATNKYKKKNPHKVKEWGLKTKYNMTLEQYEQLGDCCALCSSTKELCVDHCHTTNQVRGLLCRKCNLALGHFEDDPVRLLKAVEYLDGTCGV